MEIYGYLIFAGIVFIIFVYQSVKFRKREKQKRKDDILNSWGKTPQREYEPGELEKISRYFQKKKDNGFYIDDITWNDLGMDELYKRINGTRSSAGEEFLYWLLRVPVFDKEILKKRDALIRVFEEQPDHAYRLQDIFMTLGRTRKLALTEFIGNIGDLKNRTNIKHIILDILFLVAVVLLFVYPVPGMLLLITMLFVNIGTYYKEKADIEGFLICFQYLVDMINCAESVNQEPIDGITEYQDTLKQCLKKLSGIRKGMFLISVNGTSGSLAEMVMDYVRMIFHVDIIKFNTMLDITRKNTDAIEGLFDTIGMLDASVAIASFRCSLLYYCKPQLTAKKNAPWGYEAVELYHPMIKEPVANSITEEKSVLLTGSNASGKSTFLKTVAINSILAQTIFTCTAKTYRSPYFRTYSSMALRDNLENQESYYIVEIKSLKRIVDSIEGEIPVLCFVDEVLRGTNTVERIAASTNILKYFSDRAVFCFAATHDIELTHMLEKDYKNYHFEEQVTNNDVTFNYLLKSGRATSRNAIKLLNVMGFNQEIVSQAEVLAQNFLKHGVWEK